ncbi:ash family protein [Yersinia aleksiciae]|nr:ash family protein [Yersinia aleksiciae]
MSPAKSGGGIRTPSKLKATYTRQRVFIVASLTIPSMVAQAGQPSGWPVPF